MTAKSAALHQREHPLPDLGEYSAVLIGSPVWNVPAPTIMSTFVERADLAGKRALPFVTYAVSGMAGADQDYRDALPAATSSTDSPSVERTSTAQQPTSTPGCAPTACCEAPPERWTGKVELPDPPTDHEPLVRWEATDRHAHGAGHPHPRTGRPERNETEETRT